MLIYINSYEILSLKFHLATFLSHKFSNKYVYLISRTFCAFSPKVNFFVRSYRILSLALWLFNCINDILTPLCYLVLYLLWTEKRLFYTLQAIQYYFMISICGNDTNFILRSQHLSIFLYIPNSLVYNIVICII